MKKLLVTTAAIAALAIPSAAVAQPGFSTPANGKCVAAGVKVLGGPTIAAAATGQVVPGVNAVPIAIKAHLAGQGLLTYPASAPACGPAN